MSPFENIWSKVDNAIKSGPAVEFTLKYVYDGIWLAKIHTPGYAICTGLGDTAEEAITETLTEFEHVRKK